jgi:two-component system sensor histidine kinase DctS
MQALARFASDRWVPPLSGTLLRVEEESRLLDSVEELAGRYRLALVVNGAIMTLTLLLGLVALGQVRRSALLEAAHRYQEERRDLERRLFHSERLSSLGRLAAGMAHEINNPLEGMANYLTLLSEDLAAGRVEDAPRLLARLRQGLDRVAGAVRQVLAFAAPGQAPRSPLDLAPLLTETVEFLRGNPAFRAVRLTVETPPGPVTLVGDRLTLGQLFLNLLLNACQAQLEGGEVMVRLSTGDQEAVIEIADRGPGLAPEVAARLFEPFVSTRGSSGLGLAVCHGIATSHGGSITAGGRSGGGTVFTVRLPLEAPPEAAS